MAGILILAALLLMAATILVISVFGNQCNHQPSRLFSSFFAMRRSGSKEAGSWSFNLGSELTTPASVH